MKALVVKITEQNRQELLEIALQQHVGRQCSICRMPMTRLDLDTAVCSGPEQIAHESCFRVEMSR